MVHALAMRGTCSGPKPLHMEMPTDPERNPGILNKIERDLAEIKASRMMANICCDRPNLLVLKNNLRYAISDAIKCPPAGFQDVVNIHFYLKRNQLIKVFDLMFIVYTVCLFNVG